VGVTLHLVAELADPVIDQAVIVLLVALHIGSLLSG
jgi:hypothetical protein